MRGVEGPGVRVRPLVKLENGVEEYMRERGRGGFNQARRECWCREKWSIFRYGHPLWGDCKQVKDLSEL